MLLKQVTGPRIRTASGTAVLPVKGIVLVALLGVVAMIASACGSTSSVLGPRSGNPGSSRKISLARATSSQDGGVKETMEYVGGHWIPFISAKPLSAAQWAVVDAYANFSSAALAVYADHSVDPLATVISPQSKVTKMFQKFLAEGKDPEALYAKAVVESVSISGCRARLTLELYYPSHPPLHYISSWVRPFNKALFHGSKAAQSSRAHVASGKGVAQYAPWLFVGDNRVGGYQAPCGV